MSVMVDLPPQMERDVREYVTQDDAELARLFIGYLKKELERRRQARQNTRIAIPARVRALRGCVRLSDPRPYREIIAESVEEATACLIDGVEEGKPRANQFRSLCSRLPPSGLPKGYVFSRDEATER